MRTQRIIKKNVEIYHPELSYEIVGILFKVHDKLGRYCREKQYCDEIEAMLNLKNINYSREKFLDSDNKDNKTDFLLENVIVLTQNIIRRVRDIR